jgi:archaellum component FlaC
MKSTNWSKFGNKVILTVFGHLHTISEMLASLIIENTTDIDNKVLSRFYREIEGIQTKYSDIFEKIKELERKKIKSLLEK